MNYFNRNFNHDFRFIFMHALSFDHDLKMRAIYFLTRGQ